ncbi:hypothetical protein RR46_06298 [Papilio xuthus]|uniref:Uncharacterized protein n=1 Tax=Papilio xuthus TaxID=66420 RepID=A0A194QDW3_PAPXU|nr:hypothetical protein RR46_06298 [Papilio xuthus]
MNFVRGCSRVQSASQPAVPKRSTLKLKSSKDSVYSIQSSRRSTAFHAEKLTPRRSDNWVDVMNDKLTKVSYRVYAMLEA